MRPIVYNGVDLSGVCSAEVIEKVALPVEAETLAVPRRVAPNGPRRPRPGATP